MSRSFRRVNLLLPLAAVLFLKTISASGAEWKQLHGQAPLAAGKLTALGRLPATNVLHLAIGVPLRDPAALDQYLAEVYDPASPNRHRFLTPQEFTARFGATEADFAAVKNFALTNGFKINGDFGGRMTIAVTAKAADVERAFHLRLNRFKHPTDAREFFAPDTEPTVDARLAVLDVQGLNDYSRPHPNFRRSDLNRYVANNGSSPDGVSYLGDDFRRAYAPGSSLTGAGQQVGLFQFNGFYASDISAYAALAGGGRSGIVIQTVLTDSYNGTPASGSTEVSIDIEMVMAMAPGLSRIVVFEADPNTGSELTILASMVTNTAIKQFSCSWQGWNSFASATSENYFKQMAVQGQSFFNASGDADAYLPGALDDPVQYNYPSSSPNITQVGGTVLTMNGSGVSYASETVWNKGGGGSGGIRGGSGGGVSSNAIPAWQQGVSMAANGGSWTGRNVPDVAMPAANCYIKYGNGKTGVFGGTSCAAPLWAGFMALANQQLAAVSGSTNSSLGFANPALYEIARQSIYTSAFHDITTGNNSWSNSPSQFYAVPGYDLCTGLGTPSGTNLINALTRPDPLVVISNTGSAFGPVAGPFPFQNFILTNTGAVPLNWSIINTSAWFNVSADSGTLAAGAAAPVTVSLASAANSLPPGTYLAALWFSNATTQVTRYRLFTVSVVDPLWLLSTNPATIYGPAGGPFNPPSQTFVLTNLSPTAFSWSLSNSASWLTVSPAGGTLAGNSSVTVTVAGNTNTLALAGGTNVAALVFSNQTSHLAQRLSVTAIIGQNLVQNPGFETGDATGWTIADASGYTAVSSQTRSHSGVYCVVGGAYLTMGTVSQTLPTLPGQTYLFSFWVYNPSNGVTEIAQAKWNGANVYASTNTVIPGWLNKKYILTATGASTVIQFAMRNDEFAYFLDDISVVPVNLPAVTQQPSGSTNLAGDTVFFTAAATGSLPLAYQWRTNGISLADGGVVSGATNTFLTLAGVTTNHAGNYTLVVTNAYGAVTSGVAVLTVVLRTNSTPEIALASPQPGAVDLQLAGGYGLSYVLESRTDLVAGAWSPVATNIADYTGVWRFTDFGVTTNPARFYRLKLAQ
jgi:hypothetical protein